MQESELLKSEEVKVQPIGGWLWVILLILLSSGLQLLIHLFINSDYLLNESWKEYFTTNDETLKFRLNIYLYSIFFMSIGLLLIFYATVKFFQRKKKFPEIFLSLIAYFILSEIFKLYILDRYASLTDQEFSLETNLVKTGVIGTISGLYLNKGKRPLRTFVK